jgi:hypothetical protein
VPRAGRARRRPSAPTADLVREAGVRGVRATGEAVSFGEHARAPRAGITYHVVPVEQAGRDGFVVARELGGFRQSRVVWRK